MSQNKSNASKKSKRVRNYLKDIVVPGFKDIDNSYRYNIAEKKVKKIYPVEEKVEKKDPAEMLEVEK